MFFRWRAGVPAGGGRLGSVRAVQRGPQQRAQGDIHLLPRGALIIIVVVIVIVIIVIILLFIIIYYYYYYYYYYCYCYCYYLCNHNGL